MAEPFRGNFNSVKTAKDTKRLEKSEINYSLSNSSARKGEITPSVILQRRRAHPLHVPVAFISLNQKEKKYL